MKISRFLITVAVLGIILTVGIGSVLAQLQKKGAPPSPYSSSPQPPLPPPVDPKGVGLPPLDPNSLPPLLPPGKNEKNQPPVVIPAPASSKKAKDQPPVVIPAPPSQPIEVPPVTPPPVSPPPVSPPGPISPKEKSLPPVPPPVSPSLPPVPSTGPLPPVTPPLSPIAPPVTPPSGVPLLPPSSPVEVPPPSPALPKPKTTPVPPPSFPGTSEGQSPRLEAPSVTPTGRQEPSISLEWVGPPATKIGRPAKFQIIVKNTGNCTAQQVSVRHPLPKNVKMAKSQPEGASHENTWIWNLGTLEVGQQKRIDLELIPVARGDFPCSATVTFSGTTVARLRAREPKLALKVTSPKKILIGDTVVLALTVSNPGDGTSERVSLKTTLPNGLEHPQGKELEVEIGDLGPNETRSVQLVCTTKKGGDVQVAFQAAARDNLKAKATTDFQVVMPRLALEAKGPKLRYVDRPAVYNFTVKNVGTATATNVSLNELIPNGFKYVAATGGGRHDPATRTVSWFVGDLQPGQGREVSMKVIAQSPGDHDHRVTAVAARGINEKATVTTHVEGLSAVLMELVDLEDPIEVGAETAYEIRITNTGSKMESNLQLICTIPGKMELTSAKGPAGIRSKLQNGQLVFEKLPKLAPRADAIYRIKVRGSAPGDLRFRAQITADGLSSPVIKEESTKVYGDELLPK